MATKKKAPKPARPSARLRQLLAKPYSRVLMPAEDGAYSAEILEFPGCTVSAPTPSEAYAKLEKAAKQWLTDCLSNGRTPPRPLANENVSGRFALRLPRSLYVRAGRAAARESVSLNQYITTALAERVGASSVLHAIQEGVRFDAYSE